MTWLQTYTGKKFDYLDPQPEQICIEDITHALSLLCRFTGHSVAFYSVAEHSVHVSRLVPDHAALAGVLHDAAEAYIQDIAAPLKRLLPDYKLVEERVHRAITLRFGVVPFYRDVRIADLAMLEAERLELMHEPPEPWGLPEVDPKMVAEGRRMIRRWEPYRAASEFQHRLEGLTR